jgi:hypothetical protein
VISNKKTKKNVILTWHALEFSGAPSVVPHGATSPQVLTDEVQNKPVATVQSPVPHEHFAEFALMPLVTEQGGAITDLLHLLSAPKQKSPVEDVQTLGADVPHKQLAELAAFPFVTLQDGRSGRTQILKPFSEPPESVTHEKVSSASSRTLSGPLM